MRMRPRETSPAGQGRFAPATARNQGRIQIVLATGTVVENVFMYTYW